ncbi:IS1 family transposase [Myxococcota bacterium]|nr:IS1 family transposase [Myxococcota bacterium]
MYCPRCNHHHIVKNGSIHTGEQKYACRNCGRQFVLNPKNKPISDDQKRLINKLLLERISLAGISRVTEISGRSIQTYVNNLYAFISMIANVSTKEIRRLNVQCDEMWSFVNDKGNKVWIWLAIDVETREIIGFYAGDRSHKSAQKLWDSLPPEYRQCAVMYTDFWKAYAKVLPSKRHVAVGKETGKTNYIERFNCTLRQRVSRLVRKALSFSKKIENYIGAIWFFIHDYNAEKQCNC